MNLLARSTDYAVRAILFMAQDPDQVTSTAELESELGLPRPFMRKTLQTLQKSGYLDSVKGNKGGFTLNRLPSAIRVFDLMTIFQGHISLGECLFKKELCSCVKSCPLRKEVKKMELGLLERLKKLTIADLMKDQKAGI
ncbi:MAG: Rrf2 family transcriptional regulator [Candidatus Omnitrophica bacterium]|nr:Rrf2 family transcriptional regulator [Candidatus Omnitrophota bacterium]